MQGWERWGVDERLGQLSVLMALASIGGMTLVTAGFALQRPHMLLLQIASALPFALAAWCAVFPVLRRAGERVAAMVAAGGAALAGSMGYPFVMGWVLGDASYWTEVYLISVLLPLFFWEIGGVWGAWFLYGPEADDPERTVE